MGCPSGMEPIAVRAATPPSRADGGRDPVPARRDGMLQYGLGTATAIASGPCAAWVARAAKPKQAVSTAVRRELNARMAFGYRYAAGETGRELRDYCAGARAGTAATAKGHG